MRQVIKPRKSESDKTEKVKPTAEDVEEFGEDKKEKQDTTVVSGAKTGEDGYFLSYFLLMLFFQEKARPSPRLQLRPSMRSLSQHTRSQ